MTAEERAFPSQTEVHPTGRLEEALHPGMTLRDYFAASALTGFLSAPGADMNAGRSNPKCAAAWAYEQADAMMEARKK